MSNQTGRKPTPEQLEEMRQAQAQAQDTFLNQNTALPMPQEGNKIPLEGGGYTWVDPQLANKPISEAPEGRELTMDDMLTDQKTFEYFKKKGAFDSDQPWYEMLYEGGKAMVSDSYDWMSSLGWRAGSNLLIFDWFGDGPLAQASKNIKASARATTLQTIGDIGLNYEQLGQGASRLMDKLVMDEGSHEDNKSSYEFWKGINEIEKRRQTAAAELASSDFLMMGGDPEIRRMIREGEVKPDYKASMGASIWADPLNYISIGAGYKALRGGANTAFNGAESAMLKELQEAYAFQAQLKEVAKVNPSKKVSDTIDVMDGFIGENLNKLNKIAPKRDIALRQLAESLPQGHPLRNQIEEALTGIPLKAKSNITSKLAGGGMIATGKAVEITGSILNLASRLPQETAINLLMRLGVKEQTAMQIAQSSAVQLGMGGTATYGLASTLTDDELLQLSAVTAVIAPQLLRTYGRDVAKMGAELMQPETILPYWKRLASRGSETLTERTIDRTQWFPVKSLAEQITGAGQGKVGQRIASPFTKNPNNKLNIGLKNEPLGSTGSGGLYDLANALDKSKAGRYLELGGRMTDATAKGGAMGGVFGYVAGGGEQDEALYGGIGAGGLLGLGGGGIGGYGRFRGNLSPTDLIQARYGTHQYYTKNLLPAMQKDKFSSLRKDVQIAVATTAMSYPNLQIEYYNGGKSGKGGEQGINKEGVPYIKVNVDSPRAIEPVIKHELSHYIEEIGGTTPFNDMLIGNSVLGLKGFFTKLDENGDPIKKRDGSFETTQKFEDLKFDYFSKFDEYEALYLQSVKSAKAHGANEISARDYAKRRVLNKINQLKDNRTGAFIADQQTVREIVSEHGVDFFLNDQRRYRDLREGWVGALMRNIVDMPMVNNRQFLRTTLGKLGATFRSDGTLTTPNSLFRETQRIPMVTELIRKYNRQMEGLSAEQMQKKFPVSEAEVIPVDISGADLAKNPELIELIRAGTFLKVDDDGVIRSNKAMTPAEIKRYNKEFSESILEEVNRIDADEGLPEGHIKETKNEKTGEISFAGRFIDERVIDRLEQKGGWNKAQIDLLRQLNTTLKGGEGRGTDWLMSYFKATKKGKYVNAKVENQVHIPYGIEITQKGNILIRTISQKQLDRNINKAFRQHKAEVTRLYGADLDKAMDNFHADMHLWSRNHAEGKKGKDGLDSDPQIAEAKANFINSMFGKSSKAHVDANPWLEQVDGGKKSPTPTYRSLRLERIGKANQLTGKIHIDHNKIAKNLMPKPVDLDALLAQNPQMRSTDPNYMPKAPDTPEFRGWFKNSEIVDENGDPQVFFHGTKKNFTEFKATRYDDGLLFFHSDPEFTEQWIKGSSGHRAPSKQAQERIDKLDADWRAKWNKKFKEYEERTGKEAWKSEIMDQARADEAKIFAPFRNSHDAKDKVEGNIMPVFLSVQKLFDPRKHLDIALDFYRTDKYRRENVTGENGGRTGGWDMNDPSQVKTLEDYGSKGAYLIFENKGMVDWLASKGFDGMRLSESQSSPDYSTIAIWDNKKVKSAIANKGTFDPTNPDIRYMPKFKGASDDIPKIIEDINIATNIFQNAPAFHQFERSWHINTLVKRVISNADTSLFGKRIESAKKHNNSKRLEFAQSRLNKADEYFYYMKYPLQDLVASLPDIKSQDLKQGMNSARNADPFEPIKDNFQGGSKRPLQDILQEMANVHDKFYPESKSTLNEIRGIGEILKDDYGADIKPEFLDELYRRYRNLSKEEHEQFKAEEQKTLNELFNPEFNDVQDLGGGNKFIKPIDPDKNLMPKAPDTPEFKNWFKDSKVVDENGKPMVVYHGTNATFNSFNEGGLGNYFTNDRLTAETYGNKSKEVYLSLQNPFIIDAKGATFDPFLFDKSVTKGTEYRGLSLEDAIDRIGDKFMSKDWKDSQLKVVHDGVIIKNLIDPVDSDNPMDVDPSNVYIAFKSPQIKSATGNKGTFDPSNPDIRFMPSAERKPVTFSARPEEIVTLDSENIKNFMPAHKNVRLEDYLDYPIFCLPSDRMGVGTMFVGPEGQKIPIDFDAQGGRGFMYLYENGGWAFSNQDSSSRFLSRVEEIAGGRDHALVGITIMSDINHLNSVFGQMSLAQAYEAVIRSGHVSKEQMRDHLQDVMGRVAGQKYSKDVLSRDKKSIKHKAGAYKLSEDVRKALLSIEDPSTYKQALLDRKINFGVSPVIVEKFQQVGAKIKPDDQKKYNIDVHSVARDVADPELIGQPVGQVVALLKVPVNQKPKKVDFHLSYPWQVKGEAIGFLDQFKALEDLTSEKRVYRPDGTIRYGQPVQSVLPAFDKLNPALYMPNYKPMLDAKVDNISGLVMPKIKQDKFSPQQFKAKLGEVKGAKEMAEDLGLLDYLEGKKSVTKDEIDQYISDNRKSIMLRMQNGNGMYDGSQMESGMRGGYKEILYELPKSSKYPFPDVSGGHWKSDRILMHMRTTKRLLDDGSDVGDGPETFHIEEMQSDWHQYGRGHGYADPKDVKKVSNAEAKIENLENKLNLERDKTYEKLQSSVESFITKHALEINKTGDVISELSANQYQTSPVLKASKSKEYKKFIEVDSRLNGILASIEDQSSWFRDVISHIDDKTKKIEAQEIANRAKKQKRKLEDILDEWEETRELIASKVANSVKKINDEIHLLEDAVEKYESSKQSPAPFKNSWQHRAFADAVQMAVEQGHTYLTWTTGKRSAEMARLDNTFESVEVRYTKKGYLKPDGSNKYAINAVGKDQFGENTIRKSLSEEELKDLIGKEYAQEAITRLEKSDKPNTANKVELTDIVVPHKGRRLLYDSILPSIAKRIAKTLGTRPPTKAKIILQENAIVPERGQKAGHKMQEVWVMELPVGKEKLHELQLYMPSMMPQQNIPQANTNIMNRLQSEYFLSPKMKIGASKASQARDLEPENSYFKN
jgi:hypothetical protein